MKPATELYRLPIRRQCGYRSPRPEGEQVAAGADLPAEFIRAIRRALYRADRKGVQDGIAAAWIGPDRGCVPQ